jgi:hypothetical protein
VILELIGTALGSLLAGLVWGYKLGYDAAPKSTWTLKPNPAIVKDEEEIII